MGIDYYFKTIVNTIDLESSRINRVIDEEVNRKKLLAVLTMVNAEDRVLNAWIAPAINEQYNAIVAKFLESRQEVNKATVPIVQSQHNASGNARSHAFSAGK